MVSWEITWDIETDKWEAISDDSSVRESDSQALILSTPAVYEIMSSLAGVTGSRTCSYYCLGTAPCRWCSGAQPAQHVVQPALPPSGRRTVTAAVWAAPCPVWRPGPSQSYAGHTVHHTQDGEQASQEPLTVRPAVTSSPGGWTSTTSSLRVLHCSNRSCSL